MEQYPGQISYPEQTLPMGVYPQPAYPPSQPGYGPPGEGQHPYPGPTYPEHQGYLNGAPTYPEHQGYPNGAPTYPEHQGYPNGAPPTFQPLVTNQPGLGGAPQGAYLGPPGLEYLAVVDQLIIKQKVELLEAFTGFESANMYKVLNSLGQEVFAAKEDTDCCTRQCCGPTRPFEMNILDNGGQEVLHLVRPLRCQACCFPCCLQELEVHSPPETIIGSVEQEWSVFYPKFVIKDDRGNPIMRIEGPFCGCECCSDVDFTVTSATDGSEVGKISKQWSGLGKEIFTDADNFGINFPMDLDVKVKATLLGATFLIDFMYFEKSDQNN